MSQEETKNILINGEEFLHSVKIGNMVAIEAYITRGGYIEYLSKFGNKTMKFSVFFGVNSSSSDDSSSNEIDDDDDSDAEIKTTDATAIDDNVGYCTIYKVGRRAKDDICNLLYSLNQPFFLVNSLIQPIITLAYLCTHSFTHSLTHSLTHLLTYSLTYSQVNVIRA